VTSVSSVKGFIPTVKAAVQRAGRKLDSLYQEAKPALIPLLLTPIFPGMATIGSEYLPQEKVIKGRPITDKVTMGIALVIKEEHLIENFPKIDIEVETQKQNIDPEQLVTNLMNEFESAIEEVIVKLVNHNKDEMGVPLIEILHGHMGLKSRILDLMAENKIDVRTAIEQLFASEQVLALKNCGDTSMEKLYYDLYAMSIEILQVIHSKKVDFESALNNVGESNVILVVGDISPSDAWILSDPRIRGVVRRNGTPYDHFSICMRGKEKAGMFVDSVEKFKTGQTVIVNGRENTVILSPSLESMRKYQSWIKLKNRLSKELRNLRDLLLKTKDGQVVVMAGNAAAPEEIDSLVKHGIHSIGLVRTEMFFMTDLFNRKRKSEPDVEEQLDFYQIMADRAGKNEIVFRTIDPDHDKQFPYFSDINGQLLENGEKGLGLCLNKDKYPNYHYAFIGQLKALLQVKEKIRVMFPMVRNYREFKAAMDLVEEVKRRLLKNGMFVNQEIEYGIMVENEEVLTELPQILQDDLVKFVSIGTNDLTQSLTHTYRYGPQASRYFDSLSPKVLKAIGKTVESARENGKEVSLCGDMCNDWQGMLAALALGIEKFSISTLYSDLARKIILSISRSDLDELRAGLFMVMTPEAVRKHIEKFTLDKIESGQWSELEALTFYLFKKS